MDREEAEIGGPAAEAAAPEAEGRGGRARKKTKVFTIEAKEEAGEREVPTGRGALLSDMPNVVANFSEVTYSNPHLKILHSLCLGVGKKREFKANLMRFSGVVYPAGREEDAREALEEKCLKLQLKDLCSVMDLADIERGASSFDRNPTKPMLAARLADWLEKPSESGRSKRKLRTLKGAAKGGKKSSGAPKRKRAPKATSPKKAARRAAPPARVELNIPGTSAEAVERKIASIVASGDINTITVKNVRTELEEWLDEDLSAHRDGIRQLVMDALQA